MSRVGESLEVRVQWRVVLVIATTALASGAIGWWIDRAALAWSAALVVLLVVSFVGPLLALAGATVRLQIDPARPRVGDRAELVVRLRVAMPFVPGTSRSVLLDDSTECQIGPCRRTVVERRFELVVVRRGRLGESARLVATGPGQLVVLSRSLALDHRSLAIAWPKLVQLAVAPPPTRQPAVEGVLSVGGEEGDASGVRPYRRGMPFRSVHWIATARHGEMMVRDRHAASRRSTTVLLDASVLDALPEPREEAVARFAGTVQSLLEGGYVVRTHAGRRWRQLQRDHDLPGFLDEIALLDSSCLLPVPGLDDMSVGLVAVSVDGAPRRRLEQVSPHCGLGAITTAPAREA